MRRFELEIIPPSPEVSLANMHIWPNLLEKIKVTQIQDPKLQEICARLRQRVPSQFRVHEDGTIRFGDWVCVPNDLDLKRDILDEAHYSSYTIHPRRTKMYRGLKEHLWWKTMKREIDSFIAHYLTYQQVKAEHQRLASYLQPLRCQSGSGKTSRWIL